MLHLRTQADILSQVESRSREGANERWTETEIRNAINDALLQWQGRVSVPVLYTGTSTWGEDTFSIDLPSYIDSRSINVQFRADTESPWQRVLRWEIYPNATGGNTLQLPLNADVEWRIIHYMQNGMLPVSTVTLGSGIVSDDTSLSISGIADIAPVGFVKIGSEWIQYTGILYGASTTTLSNLLRAQYNTQAAAATSGSTVHFGIAAPQADLFRQLVDQTLAYMHEVALSGVASQDRDIHERLVSFYQSRADMYWRRFVPARSPQILPYIVDLSPTYNTYGVDDAD